MGRQGEERGKPEVNELSAQVNALMCQESNEAKLCVVVIYGGLRGVAMDTMAIHSDSDTYSGVLVIKISNSYKFQFKHIFRELR